MIETAKNQQAHHTISRWCALCEAKIVVELDDHGVILNGHAFFTDEEETPVEDEYWECANCYEEEEE